MLSEVASYLDATALNAAAQSTVEHRVLGATDGLTLLASYRDDDFLLDVFTRGSAVSVAKIDGVLGSGPKVFI